jgi:hypothetical protein
MARQMRAKDTDGEWKYFEIGEQVSFKSDVEQTSKILDVRAGQVLVKITAGDYARGEQWIACDRCWFE